MGYSRVRRGEFYFYTINWVRELIPKQTNRLACLSLVYRCAYILISIEEEVRTAGGLHSALDEPLARLLMCVVVILKPKLWCLGLLFSAFQMVAQMMQKQAERPFLKRYLKRDDITRQIRECNDALTSAVDVFSVSRSLEDVLTPISIPIL